MSFRTIKIPIKFHSETDENQVISLQKKYNSVVRFTYNRLFENQNLTTKEITEIQKNLNNCDIGSHLLNCAQQDAKAILISQKQKLKKNEILKQIIFGGNKLFQLRNKLKISKEEFQEKRFLPLNSIGESSKNSNRFFQITNSNTILFKPNKDTKIYIELPKLKKNLQKDIDYLFEVQGYTAISYKLSKSHIWISFDNNSLYQIDNELIENRVFSIDMNPNEIGWSVIDWRGDHDFKIIDKGLISLKPLNDKWFELNKLGDISSNDPRRVYFRNKLRYEIVEISKDLLSKALHYKCQIFSIEDLKFRGKDNERGRNYNVLVNNLWIRNLLNNQVIKRCDLNRIEVEQVDPAYSSFHGNLVYRELNLPDCILASIEISRRGYEFHNQYISKKKLKKKNIIFDECKWSKIRIRRSLEELGYFDSFTSLRELYDMLNKTINMKYKVPLVEKQVVYSHLVRKRNLRFYEFR